MLVPGLTSRMALIVLWNISAPPLSKSSRVTDVMTACFSPMALTASATRSGSAQSSSVGFRT